MDKSRAYSNIVERLGNNTYKKNTKQQKANRRYLERTRRRLQKRNTATIKYKRGHNHKLEKINALLHALDKLSAPSPSPSSTLPYSISPSPTTPTNEAWINETLAQGDCFYSSLYRASKERGLLPIIAGNLGINVFSESKFIKSFRALIASEVKAGRLPNSTDQHGKKEDTYDILAGMGSDLGAAIAYGNVFPDWFVKSFRKGVGTRKQFQNTFAKYAKQRKQYVSEIEVDITKSLLKDKCGILLEITGLTKAIVEKQKDGMPLLTFYNAYGGHYEYYTFEQKCPTRGKKRNTATRRCS